MASRAYEQRRNFDEMVGDPALAPFLVWGVPCVLTRLALAAQRTSFLSSDVECVDRQLTAIPATSSLTPELAPESCFAGPTRAQTPG